jgi:hypothetical protein
MLKNDLWLAESNGAGSGGGAFEIIAPRGDALERLPEPVALDCRYCSFNGLWGGFAILWACCTLFLGAVAICLGVIGAPP